MDCFRKYSEIAADYNRKKDRVTLEETFARLVDLSNSVSAEQRRATEEGLIEEELALFDPIAGVRSSRTTRCPQTYRHLVAQPAARRGAAGCIRRGMGSYY